MKFIQLLNLCLTKNIPFVSYRLPGKKDILTWIQLSGVINFAEDISEVSSQSGFVYAPFHRMTNFPLVFFKPEIIFINENYSESLVQEISNKPPLYTDYSSEIPVEVTKEEYLRQAEKYINSFQGEFSKAILSRVILKDKPKKFNIVKYYLNLHRSYQNAFCHLIHLPGIGTWTGASPESLIGIENDTLQTISLAGTQASPVNGQKISWTDKEREEQKIVTDYIESVVQKFQITDYRKENEKNFKAGNTVHLATKFRFNKSLVGKKLGEFISELHPTPAVCGFPKEKALQLIQQTEKHNREYYAGFSGPLNFEKKTDLFVNLRCMKITDDKLALFTGGGLTAKSDPEKEWDETVLKAKTLLSVM